MDPIHVGLREMPLLFEGDIVTYGRDKTRLYKVTRVKQVKLIATESGTGNSYELRIEHCRKAENPEDFVAAGREVLDAPGLALGMPVKWRNPSTKTRGAFVVIGQTAAGWKVSRFGGGDGMRYFHSIDARDLVPLTNEELLDLLS